MNFKTLTIVATGVSTLFLSGCQSASGGKYAQLSEQGYSTSKFTHNRAGVRGWYVSKGQEKYWCRMGPISTVQGGPTGMGIFLQSGRFIAMNKKSYVEHLGSGIDGAPRYEDLMSGKLKPEYVGDCQKV